MTIKKTLFFLIVFSVGVPTAMCQQVGQPGPAGDYIKQGNAYYDNKEYSKAISIYEKAAKENPGNTLGAVAHYKCAKAFNAMGKYNEAISECSQSIAIDPMMNKGIAYLLRAVIYEKTKKYAEAISDYSKALIITPNYKEVWVCRQKLLIGLYTNFTKDGMAAFNSGLAAYNGRKYAAARKDLDKGSLLFAYAMSFDIGDKTAFAMADFAKGLSFQIMTRKILDTIKPTDSNKDAAPQLVSAYYTLAVTNAYYEKASPILKNEKLKNSLKELKAVNDKDMAMVKPRVAGLESGSDKYMKAADLEATCIVNFDAASQCIALGDREGAKRVLDENDAIAAQLKKIKSANAEGIGYLSDAYAGLNTIFSYPLTDPSWLKTNKSTLDGKISDCLRNLDRAKSALISKELLNNCEGLLKNVSTLQEIFKKINEKT